MHAYRNETVILSANTRDEYGEPGDPLVYRNVPARVDRKVRWVRNFAGEQVVATGTVFVAPQYGEPFLDDALHDKSVTLASGEGHQMIGASPIGAFRVDHYEVYIA